MWPSSESWLSKASSLRFRSIFFFAVFTRFPLTSTRLHTKGWRCSHPKKRAIWPFHIGGFSEAFYPQYIGHPSVGRRKCVVTPGCESGCRAGDRVYGRISSSPFGISFDRVCEQALTCECDPEIAKGECLTAGLREVKCGLLLGALQATAKDGS